jgi:hypothetical protein
VSLCFCLGLVPQPYLTWLPFHSIASNIKKKKKMFFVCLFTFRSILTQILSFILFSCPLKPLPLFVSISQWSVSDKVNYSFIQATFAPHSWVTLSSNYWFNVCLPKYQVPWHSSIPIT